MASDPPKVPYQLQPRFPNRRLHRYRRGSCLIDWVTGFKHRGGRVHGEGIGPDGSVYGVGDDDGEFMVGCSGIT
jgi:hypothetical protein